MIKTIKTHKFKIIAAVLAVVLLMYCFTRNTPITVHAAITSDGALTGSMASLGFYVQGSADKYTADHERYDYSDDGWVFNTTSTNDATQMLFNGTGYDYIAYSPYSIKTTSDEDYLHDNSTFSVPTDGDYDGAWSESGGPETYVNPGSVSGSQYDLLWGNGTAYSAGISVNLQHVLSMIVVNITGMGTELEDGLTVTGVTIDGTRTTGTLNLTTATSASEVITVNDDEYATPIKAAKFTNDGGYEALIIPQETYLNISVTLSNGQVYRTTTGTVNFQPGNTYTINLQVGQDKVELGGITASPWESGDGIRDLETE